MESTTSLVSTTTPVPTRTSATGSTCTLILSQTSSVTQPITVSSDQSSKDAAFCNQRVVTEVIAVDGGDVRCEMCQHHRNTDDEEPESEESEESEESDGDLALRFYHEDEVAYRRSIGLHFHMGCWFRAGPVYPPIGARPLGVVFEEDEDECQD
ncbi:hypothetical protein DPEC_G00377270 [Dallia pectoralis]|nr:hypothetical protein DPEC_G00377270 [Dallia pectoralis]